MSGSVASTATAALVEAARGVMDEAYAPYSGFRVGAALQATDGRIFVGCNVENSSYPAGLCAERSAVAAAVAHGARSFSAVAVVTEADRPTPPCGICRQVLVEFAPALRVVSVTTRGAASEWALADLLPAPFTPDSLAHA